MFKQIPTTITEPLCPKQKVQKLITEIGGGSYMEKNTKGLPQLRRPNLSKNHKIRRMEFKKHMKLIGIIIIGNSNYIGSKSKIKSEKTFSVSSIFLHK